MIADRFCDKCLFLAPHKHWPEWGLILGMGWVTLCKCGNHPQVFTTFKLIQAWEATHKRAS